MKNRTTLLIVAIVCWAFCVLLVASAVFAADTKITEMTEDTTPTTDDLVMTVNNPGGTPANRKVTLGNFATAIGALIGTISGNAETATALAANPTDCTSGAVANAIDASGNLSCTAYTLAAPGAAGGLLQSDGTNWARVTSLTGLSLDIGTSVASGHAVTMDVDGKLQTAFDALLPDSNAGASLGSLSGTWTDLYLGNGSKLYFAGEDLTFNVVSTTSLSIGSGSGITDLSFASLNLATIGTIQGGIKINSDADGMTAANMTAVGLYGTMFIATGAGTWILPTAAVGMSACLMDSGTAHDLILDVTAGDTMRLKGTEQADGIGVTNAAGTSTGDFICVIAVAANKWSTAGMQGTWASQ